MLMIRLQRMGKKKKPTYRLIVSEKTKDTQAGSLEILGIYNPTEKEKIIEFKQDRIEYWLSQGAQPSATVSNLLVNAGVISAKKQKSVTISNKRRAKLDEKAAAAKEAEAAAAPAEETPAEASEEKSAEEAPAEEPKTEEAPAEEKKDE